jgi:serine/threonine protein kinase
MEWELHKLLGNGSYGNVHLVRNSTTKEYAALKTSICVEDGTIVLGALREVFFYSSFSPCPGVCTSLGHWKSGNNLHILMPLYPCTLESVYTQFQNTLPFNDFLRLLRQSLAGLKAMHKQGYLHRDIKPENILVSTSGVSLTDFNLMRWAAFPSSNSSSEKKCAASLFPQLNGYRNSEFKSSAPNHSEVLKENASSYVCTLWTRAPELVKNLIEKHKKMKYGSEIDVFSLGSTFLALAAGDFVLGKKCSLAKVKPEVPDSQNAQHAYQAQHAQNSKQEAMKEEKEKKKEVDGDGDVRNTNEYRYLGGFLKTFGINKEITELYGAEFCSEREWETSGMAVYEFIKHQLLWTSEQLTTVSNLLARMLHPLPQQRACVNEIEKWLEKYSDVSEEFSQSLLSFLSRRQAKLIQNKQSTLGARIVQEKCTLPSRMPEFSSVQFWLMCSSNFIPPYIACEVIRIKNSIPLSLSYSKALLYLLDCMHEFQLAENYKLFAGVDLDHVFVLASLIKPSRETLELALSLSPTPFILCCLAAELFVTGKTCTAEELKRSKTMHLSNVKPFFEAYGINWKSQTSLRQTWNRLS